MSIFEFHINKVARKKYDVPETLFSIDGSIIIAKPWQARVLTEKINKVRREEGKADQQITTGELNAFGLLHEIFHFIIREYEQKENPGVFGRGISYLREKLGEDKFESVLLEFIDHFPPVNVYKGKITPEQYLNGTTEGKLNKEILIEEVIILHLENINPAAVRLEEMFSDKELVKNNRYPELLEAMEQFFIQEKPMGKENLPLLQFLKKPILKNPYTLEGQLDFIKDEWGVYIYEVFYERILKGKDLIYEDVKMFIQHGGGEKGTPPVPEYTLDKEYYELIRRKVLAGEALSDEEKNFYYAEPERFTEDIEWMPKVVMIAKNTYVWLHQLSKKYNKQIKTLDQIPDEELDQLAKWNFTSLWLIGIWERSSASKKIKHYTGNPEAVSSAYSLFDYIIAHDLGGETAYEDLKRRAWHRGIRLASDMVPNHTGIYSKWVVEKPDYFLKSDYPPYPGYSFNGPNLSDDDRVEVRIEDKYYTREDAAVVFERKDKHTGDRKYIYHGNDGTNMPWNDTAQLDLLKPEVRESLIQTIMHVARKFPIIRFDAAMTLAKKHYQRLWFPQPGTGGAVPSRSDYALTRAQFDEAMPEEFWREVVDRINKEMPQTLLLAEAFWLMESYFVRTLGMHRVYNSAFMHMLMKEENDKFRALIKNTIEFNPEILKRYVNFMSNPDEETAVNQFGKGDKYIGICMLMVTLPGLPMFAHGQIEGFSEKYGMEYQRAYYDEQVDMNLVKRHEKEIFPLMAMRHLFSQVTEFEFFDFISQEGDLNENVICFSNKTGNEQTLIIYNNSYSYVRGRIRNSNAKVNGGNRNIASVLGMRNDHNYYYIYKDHRTGLEFISSGSNLHKDGLDVELFEYQYHLFMNIKEVYDSNGVFKKLCNFLNGRGVHDIYYTLQEMNLQGVHDSLRQILTPAGFNRFNEILTGNKDEEEIPYKIKNLVNEINQIQHLPLDEEKVIDSFYQRVDKLNEIISSSQKEEGKKRREKWSVGLNKYLNISELSKKRILFPLVLIDSLRRDINYSPFERVAPGNILRDYFEQFGHNKRDAGEDIYLLKIITDRKFLLLKNGNEKEYLKPLFMDKVLKDYLKVHEYNKQVYFNKERYNELMEWALLQNCSKEDEVKAKDKKGVKAAPQNAMLKENINFFESLIALGEKCNYNLEQLMSLSAIEKKPVKKESVKKETGIKETGKKAAVKKEATAKVKTADKKEVTAKTEKKTTAKKIKEIAATTIKANMKKTDDKKNDKKKRG
jgi:glycosidase